MNSINVIAPYKYLFEPDPSRRCTDRNNANFYWLTLMLGNVRCRYPEAGLFLFPPWNLLLPNSPDDPAE